MLLQQLAAQKAVLLQQSKYYPNSAVCFSTKPYVVSKTGSIRIIETRSPVSTRSLSGVEPAYIARTPGISAVYYCRGSMCAPFPLTGSARHAPRYQVCPIDLTASRAETYVLLHVTTSPRCGGRVGWFLERQVRTPVLRPSCLGSRGSPAVSLR